MLLLPPYDRHGDALRLPISLRAAWELLAAAAEAEVEPRTARLSDALRSAPGLVLWSWRHRGSPGNGATRLVQLACWLNTTGLHRLAQDAWAIPTPQAPSAALLEFPVIARRATAEDDDDYVAQVVQQAETWEAQACAAQFFAEPFVVPCRLLGRIEKLQLLEAQFQQALESEKLEALAEFAAGAGHEINNPLAVISGRAQLFLRSETDPERRRELAIMHQQALRVHEMIADLMLFARPPLPQSGPCDAAGIADQVLRELAERAATRGIRLVHRAAHRPLEIKADREQLVVALRSVCDNALAAVGDGGSVEIETRPWLPADDTARRSTPDDNSPQSATGAEWIVTDDGPGISAEVRRHLFDPYYSGRSAGRGLGVGLAKCWRIVTNHGGEVWVQDAPQRGARLHLRIPAQIAPPA